MFFNFEKYLHDIPHNPTICEEIRLTYASILYTLKNLTDKEIITAYEASTLADALKTVLGALGKKNDAEEEVTRIKGGTILEFRAALLSTTVS